MYRDRAIVGREQRVLRAIDAMRRRHAEPRPGCDEAAVRAWEAESGVVLPGDYVCFLRQADGTARMDDHFIRFLPLPMLEQATPQDRTCWCVAEFLIWSHAFGIQTSGAHAGCVIGIDAGPPVIVAPSFDAFLAIYLSDPERLMAP
jgi:hypothetical protein